MSNSPNNLIWIDLEMTGLSPDEDRIIEIATVITNQHLDVLAEGPVVAIHQSDEIMLGMDAWNTRHHGDSGLTQRVSQSTSDENEAQARTIEFLQKWVDTGASPMCGNSICQDRRFMAKSMPLLEVYFHYRNLDVSTLKELARRWAPEVAAGVNKAGRHLALSDIHDSINELKHYRDNLFDLARTSPTFPVD